MAFKDRKKYSEEPKHKLKQLYIGISKWDTANFFPTQKNVIVGVSFRNYLFDSKNKWLDTIFSQQDKDFLYKQFNAQIDTIWRHSFANSRFAKSTKQKKPNRYYLSLPLFTINKKFAILRETYYCGSLCAYSGFKIYRRKNDNSWEYIGSVNNWMS